MQAQGEPRDAPPRDWASLHVCRRDRIDGLLDVSAKFSARSGRSLTELLVGEAGVGDIDEEVFRASVSDNLARGRFRLIIAVDEITEELNRVVLYINGHTTSSVNLLAFELRYTRQGDVEDLVPMVFGEEGTSPVDRPSGRRWTNESFFTELSQLTDSQDVLDAACQLYSYLKVNADKLDWGRGKVPSVTAHLTVGEKSVSVLTLYAWPGSEGLAQVNFGSMVAKGVALEDLRRLADRLTAIPGAEKQLRKLEEAGFKKYPSFWFESMLSQPASREVMTSALDELMTGTSAVRSTDAHCESFP